MTSTWTPSPRAHDNLPPALIRDSRELLERLHREAITCIVKRVIAIFRKNLDIMGFTPDAGELAGWARALASGLNIVLVANLWSDFRLGDFSLGPCVAAVSERGPFLAKAAGWDENTHPGATFHALRFHCRGVPRFQIAGHQGLVGSTAGCLPNGTAAPRLAEPEVPFPVQRNPDVRGASRP